MFNKICPRCGSMNIKEDSSTSLWSAKQMYVCYSCGRSFELEPNRWS